MYETSHLLAQAAQWRLQAERSNQPAHKDYCLQQALKFEQIVQRSLEVPPISDAEADSMLGLRIG